MRLPAIETRSTLPGVAVIDDTVIAVGVLVADSRILPPSIIEQVVATRITVGDIRMRSARQGTISARARRTGTLSVGV
ncbi:MAG: hypothetical protein KatS3mg038_1952 [Candidatus Kapaibacterium sp.]|nr:MAG: hypothetical protein KatS3mg038_1952 [Candidatus Kapabacteria bacterium]